MSKVLFIESRKKFPTIDFSVLDNLPGKIISIAATVQYLSFIPQIKKYLESMKKKVVIKKGSAYPAHVLGCQSAAFDSNAETLLLIADGKFHALNNAVQLNREVYIFDIRKIEKVSRSEIDKIKSKIKGKLNLFFSSEKIGLLVSTKYGQHYRKIGLLKERIQKKGKEVYIFKSDTINLSELENFPEIRLWINTACSGIGLEQNKILNVQDILPHI
mgnify:CR=1 FL=1